MHYAALWFTNWLRLPTPLMDGKTLNNVHPYQRRDLRRRRCAEGQDYIAWMNLVRVAQENRAQMMVVGTLASDA